MNRYKIVTTEQYRKKFNKLDNSTKQIILNWISKHLYNTDNPRSTGKALVGNLKGYWRYRIGSYRLLVEIHDDILTIITVDIDKREIVYDK